MKDSRREFIKKSAIATAGMALNLKGLANINNNQLFTGIQITPHSIIDEGIDNCLDLLQEKGSVDTLMLNPYNFYGAMGRPLELMADHGVPKIDNTKRTFPLSWVRHDPEQFSDTYLKFPKSEPGTVYENRDIFQELIRPVRQRNMKIYVRLYEGWENKRTQNIANWNNVLSVDMYGKRHRLPCFNHPEFRKWWLSTIENLLFNYDIDGIQFGFERANSLHHVMMDNTVATCFCDHCKSKAKRNNIDPDRAKEGYIKLYEFLQKVDLQDHEPLIGVFPQVVRIWVEYPEIFAWEKQEHQSKMEIPALMYGTVKTIKPNVKFGLHLPDSVCRNIFTRAAENYHDMTPYSDFQKLIVYHEVEGYRMHRDLGIHMNRLFKGVPESEISDLFFNMFNYNPDDFPAYKNMVKRGLGPKYVYQEIRRCVEDVNGKSNVYAGIGMDIPIGSGWGNKPYSSDQKQLEMAVRKAYEAGASGVVASREYEEISLKSLETFGNAVKSYS